MEYLSFTSIKYGCFLLICIFIYYLIPKKQWIVLLIESICFYIFCGTEKMILVILTSIVVWYASKKISAIYSEAEKEADEKQLKGKEKVQFFAPLKKKCRKYYLVPTLVLVIGMLGYCKFASMLANEIAKILGTGVISLKIIVPLGISYYTFSTVGYLLDVYWRKQKYIDNYFKFALCVFYFPQIVQGPIARYGNLVDKLTQRHQFDYKQVCFGLQLMLYGYFKKMVLADRLALFTTQVFGNIGEYQGFVFIIATIFIAFQLYFDFSGCMDIVRGTSQLFGIELDKNFNHPFFSKNVAEFWRRWHITLGTWFKDYVYFPIATSPRLLKRAMKVREKRGAVVANTFSTAVPLVVVWLLTGIWHGTGMNYVVWGLYYGTIILFSTVLAKDYKKVADFLKIDTTTMRYQRFQMIRTFAIFAIGRLITVPGSLTATARVIKQTCSSFNLWIFWDGSIYSMGMDFKDYMVVLFGVLFVWKVSRIQEKGDSVRELIAQKNIIIRWTIYYVAIFAIILFGIYGVGYNASDFVYARF